MRDLDTFVAVYGGEIRLTTEGEGFELQWSVVRDGSCIWSRQRGDTVGDAVERMAEIAEQSLFEVPA